MTIRTIDAESLRRALTLRDLTNPAQGAHCMQLLIEEIERALIQRWNVEVRRARMHPVVSVEENYDRLLVRAEAVSRDTRYTRYVNERTVLRTMTSAMIPPLLDGLASSPAPDVVLSCPGIVYRRDAIDRAHVGEPHQLDVWRIRTTGPSVTLDDLRDMIAVIVDAALPGTPWRTVPAVHPYTTDGLQIDAAVGEDWVEIGECGMANPVLLARCGLDVPTSSGLAMGLGLDRLLMLRKGIDDIRLLRSQDPRVTAQMLDLEPYRPVSSMPPVRRDLSIAIDATAELEDMGDRVRGALGDEAGAVEEIAVVSETAYDDLPDVARERLGIGRDQKNVLVRIVLRHRDRTLTDEDANVLRDRIYAALHEGSVHMWTTH